MQAYEFESVYRDGVITVPEWIRDKIYNTSVKVILMQREEKPVESESSFQAIHVNTAGFVFNREEANCIADQR
ncbi:hypothetical protein FACS18948_5040 [Clostridia bacterium]|nr:hypothetical protein FACS18948_5040 [Clostridia bacterium]